MGKLLTHEEFVKRSNKKHNGFYNYDKTVYKNSNLPVTITCPIHGDFEQIADVHSRMGCGCTKCSIDRSHERQVNKNWKEDFTKLWKGKYDYSESEYVNLDTKMKIKCNDCGNIFYQYPRNHKKYGCPRCGGNERYTKNLFIEKAKKVHGNRYDYSEIPEKLNTKTIIPIKCNNHGTFYQSVNHHISAKHGCPRCRMSKGEEYIKVYADNINEPYTINKTFPTCFYKKPLQFDFWFPNKNLVIEFDGVQHEKEVKRFGGKKAFEENKIKDEIKDKWCKENNITLIRIHYKDLRSGNIKNILDTIFL